MGGRLNSWPADAPARGGASNPTGGASPYRESFTVGRAEPAPVELVCTALDRDIGRKAGVGVLQFLMLPATVGGLLAPWCGWVAGLCGTVGTGLFILRWWRRQRRVEDCVLRVEDGKVAVWSRGLQRTCLRFGDLADVALDSKTIRPVVDGGGWIPAARLIDTRVSPDVELSRVVLIDGEGHAIPVGDRYIAHLDAMEWLGRIRLFLRKNSWIPEDERETGEEGKLPA